MHKSDKYRKFVAEYFTSKAKTIFLLTMRYFKRTLFTLGASLTFATAMADNIQLTASQINAMIATKNYSWVSVHDPSIVYNEADKNYYIVGSHRGLARTSDLTNMIGLDNSNIYSTDYATAFKSCPAHKVSVKRNNAVYDATLPSYNAGAFCATYAKVTEAEWIAGNQWAPDIVYNANMKKWCMYLSLNGDNWASVIVLLTADSPTGPFTYQGPIVFSGFNGQTYSGKSVSYKDTDLEIVLGAQSSLPSRYNTTAWGNYWPNCIDPCVFFDESGELWMAYGSWSGGIFMLKLDKNTGLRDYTTTYNTTRSGNVYTSDQYFGKLIAGGAYVSGEGSYIQKIGNYYYLFMSYGFYSPDGGYEMRIFRSKNPDGPFVDGLGNTATYTAYQLNYGPKAVTNKGMKIIGAMNGWGNMTVGECAEGHNSAIVDDDGDAFVVYHTKFNDGTVGHQVRVRQLFTNEKGWLVASPFRYTGKQTKQSDIESKQLFSADDIAGTYQLLLHPYRLDYVNMQESTPVTVTLTADGKITGAQTGTWRYSSDGKSYVTMLINGTMYYGVALEQNVDGQANMPATCFSAVSNNGVPVWLYKLQPKAAVASGYSEVKSYFANVGTTITENAPQPANITTTYTVTNYTTKEPDNALSESGVFTPTEDGHRIMFNVTMTAPGYTAKIGPYIKATGIKDNTDIKYPVSVQKNTTSAWWSNFSKEDYTLQKGETMEFQFYNYSNKSANYNNWSLYGANATHGAANYHEYFGIRCDNWDNTTASNTGCLSDYNWDTFCDDMDNSLVKMTVTYVSDGTFTMKAVITTESGKTYNYSYTKNITEQPASINLFFVSEGSYIDGSSIPTNVETITASSHKKATDNIFYNLAGQKVADNYKGIVVRNGKVYIKK